MYWLLAGLGLFALVALVMVGVAVFTLALCLLDDLE